MLGIRNVYRISVAKPQRSRIRQKFNIKINLKDMVWMKYKWTVFSNSLSGSSMGDNCEDIFIT
jgi:hypothetical protein